MATITPPGGTYNAPLSVILTPETTGGVIYYTLDGSTPDPSAALVEGAFDTSSLNGAGDETLST